MSHALALRVPPHSVRWFKEGEHCADPRTGDLLLVDHLGPVARAITVGEWALQLTQKYLRDYTWCDHSAIISHGGEGGQQPIVSEMGPHGHEMRALETYRHRLYAVVNFDVDDDARAQAVANDVACRDVEYGYVQYLAMMLNGLTGARLSVSWGSSIICSTHATLCLMGLGLFPDRQPASVAPCHLAWWTGAQQP